MTEADIDAICARAGDDALIACGKLLPPASGAELKHIVLMAAAAALIGVAAQTVVRDQTGQQPPPDDPMVVALIHNWVDAIKLYPDTKAIAARMTELRDHLQSGAVIPRWYEGTPEVRRLMEQIATCRDPIGQEQVDVDDCVETLSRIIRGAKAIVGDLEDKDADWAGGGPENEEGGDDD